jgi:rod shape-determining protein MreD
VSGERNANWRHFWLGLLVLATLAFLQGANLLRFGRSRLGPDLVLAAVVAWSFLNDSAAGALWGFTGGLILDGLSAAPFPLNTLALCLVGALVGAGHLSLYADQTIWATASGLLGALLFYAISLAGLHLAGMAGPFGSTLRTLVLPCLALDTLCVLLFLPLLRRLSRRLSGTAGVR